MRPSRIARRLAPRHLHREARRIVRKIVRRLRRVDERVIRVPARGKERRGAALFSYVIDPFVRLPWQGISHDHTHDWESWTMAHILADLGFDVDVISWTNDRFVPERPYDLFVDVRRNLERLDPLLPASCLRVMHIETGHWRFHNEAQAERLRALEERRGIRLEPFKLVEENRAIEHADCATILGNDFTAGTYEHADKPLYRVPISNPVTYSFPTDRDWERARRSFVWFGSGGLVHKGLDLVLDAFAGLPDLRLTVCGPVTKEPDFEAAYARELYEAPTVDTVGWVDVTGSRFREITRNACAVVYPSCSEGGGGSVITCLHAGLIPVVTPETSVDVDPAWGLVLDGASVDEIRAAVADLSSRPTQELDRMARGAWRHARNRHTKEVFETEYRRVMEEILVRHEAAADDEGG